MLVKGAPERNGITNDGCRLHLQFMKSSQGLISFYQEYMCFLQSTLLLPFYINIKEMYKHAVSETIYANTTHKWDTLSKIGAPDACCTACITTVFV